MIPAIVPVVEGPGDAEALPILLRKILTHLGKCKIGVATAKNAHGCGNLEKAGGLEKFVEYAFRSPACGGVLIAVDTDHPARCPKALASALAARIRAYGARKPVAVVLAENEFETWFLASIESIAGKAIKGSVSIQTGAIHPAKCEEIRNPKSWLQKHFTGRQAYKETLHQAPMASLIDVGVAESRSRSFRRLVHAVSELTQAIERQHIVVTP